MKLAGAQNQVLALPARPGTNEFNLILQVGENLVKQDGKLILTKFQSQSSPPDVSDASIRLADGKQGPGPTDSLPLTLLPSQLIHLKVAAGPLDAGAVYKGSLFLSTSTDVSQWEISLHTGAKGTLAVEPVGTMKYVTFPWRGCPTGAFPVTLRDKSGDGPYRRIRARFEPSGAPASKSVSSNFSLDSVTFWEATEKGLQRIDLEQRRAPAGAASRDLDLERVGLRTFTVQVGHLAPGEYAGALKFGSAETSDDAPEAKLPLTLQVRHHWSIPIAFILLGSLTGWFTSKYIVALRKNRDLRRAIETLRARIDDLARPGTPTGGWEFPGEATSYGLVRVSVLLSQLAKLAETVAPILVHEEEIQRQRSDVELRVGALENLREMRLLAQGCADGKPAAQVALGGLLRRAHDVLERPTFGPDQQGKFNALLQTVAGWKAQPLENYRAALVERLTCEEIPTVAEVNSSSGSQLVRRQLVLLRKACPSGDDLKAETELEELRDCDEKIAKVALLWREKDSEWAESLAQACEANASLHELFCIVDQRLWNALKSKAEAGEVAIEPDTKPQGYHTYDLVELRLTSRAPDLDTWRILYHPLHLVWRITPPKGGARTSESHDLSLAQYFPAPGTVTVEAKLSWQGREIPLKEKVSLAIQENRAYLGRRMLYSGGIAEWMVIVIATAFAAATAMSAQYDSTFGTLNQYIALFLWAAGAGTGGNLFKQLGTSSTPGGQADVSLPAAAPGAGAAKGG